MSSTHWKCNNHKCGRYNAQLHARAVQLVESSFICKFRLHITSGVIDSPGEGKSVPADAYQSRNPS